MFVGVSYHLYFWHMIFMVKNITNTSRDYRTSRASAAAPSSKVSFFWDPSQDMCF